MVRIWNTAPQIGHFLRISYFAWAILYIIKVYYSFVEHHRLKCRVNDLMQNYDKNPKAESIQSLTKIKIGATQ